MLLKPSLKKLVFQLFISLIYSLLISSLIFTVLLIVIKILDKSEAGFFYQSSNLLTSFIILFFITYIFSLIRSYLYIKNSHISTNSSGVEVLESSISRKKITIPYAKLTVVELTQGIIERMLNLSTIHITNDESDENLEFDGFDFDKANAFTSKLSSEYNIKISNK